MVSLLQPTGRREVKGDRDEQPPFGRTGPELHAVFHPRTEPARAAGKCLPRGSHTPSFSSGVPLHGRQGEWLLGTMGSLPTTCFAEAAAETRRGEPVGPEGFWFQSLLLPGLSTSPLQPSIVCVGSGDGAPASSAKVLNSGSFMSLSALLSSCQRSQPQSLLQPLISIYNSVLPSSGPDQ